MKSDAQTHERVSSEAVGSLWRIECSCGWETSAVSKREADHGFAVHRMEEADDAE